MEAIPPTFPDSGTSFMRCSVDLFLTLDILQTFWPAWGSSKLTFGISPIESKEKARPAKGMSKSINDELSTISRSKSDEVALNLKKRNL